MAREWKNSKITFYFADEALSSKSLTNLKEGIDTEEIAKLTKIVEKLTGATVTHVSVTNVDLYPTV